MMQIREGQQSELWQALLAESAARQRVTLDENEESYLGFVLIRHMRDSSLAVRVMALDWLEAGAAAGTRRADALRDVGDRCLLIAGLYPQLARRRRVTPDYYIALGRDAYGGISQGPRTGYALLFAQLAEAFERLVDVLRAVRGNWRSLPDAGGARQLVATGSARWSDPRRH